MKVHTWYASDSGPSEERNIEDRGVCIRKLEEKHLNCERIFIISSCSRIFPISEKHSYSIV